MIREIEQYIALFFIYSFAGWLMEVIRVSKKEKKFVDRGFLIGPYCPIYGCGVLLITILLRKYTDDIIVTFFMSLIICGTLEYLTSYLMEKIFKARWWDYSDRKFNINGRVCLENLIPFGIAGCIIVYIINPFLLNLIDMVPDIVMNIMLGILVVLFIADIAVSFKIILNLKVVKKELKDNTDEISEKVKKIILKKSRLYRRLVNAFPRIKDNVKFYSWEELKLKLEESRNEWKAKIDNSKAEIRGILDNSKQNFKKLYKKNDK